MGAEHGWRVTAVLSACALAIGCGRLGYELGSVESDATPAEQTLSLACNPYAPQGTSFDCVPTTEPSVQAPTAWRLGPLHSCAWATVDPVTGVINGLPAVEDVGRCTIDLLADPALAASQELTVNPLVEFASSSSAVDESGSYMRLALSLSAPAASDIHVPVAVSGSGVSGLAGEWMVPAGTQDMERVFRVLDDQAVDGDQVLSVSLGTPLESELGANTSHALTIVDNDHPPLANVASISAGHFTICVAQEGGSVLCWGDNSTGQFGDGTTASSNTPVPVPALLGVKSLSVGVNHSCAVLVDGAWCWGQNSNGKLGNGTTSSSTLPVPVTGLGAGVTSIAAGNQHSCALRSGDVVCWGRNNYGQLGDASNSTSSVPVSVALPRRAVAIDVGDEHSCAVLDDGSVRCWGLNSRRQLGDTTNVNASVPVQPVGLGVGTDAIDVSLGYDHSCIWTSSGDAWCWGNATFGQQGRAGSGSATPGLVANVGSFSKLSLQGQPWEGGGTCALDNGGVKCWGTNSEGALGDGSFQNRNVPVDVQGLTSGVVDVARTIHTSCAVRSDGSVYCWGTNQFATLGTNELVEHYAFPVPVEGLGPGTTESLALGGTMSYAKQLDGSLKVSGMNTFGQLGLGDQIPSFVPSLVVGLSGIDTLSSGLHHGCVRIGDRVQCWGRNGSGEVGAGDVALHSSPLDVVGLSSGVREMTTGNFHGCAVMDAGEIRCWGWNNFYSLGDGTNASTSRPKVVAGVVAAEVADIFAGYGHTCIVTPLGALKCWGWNSEGQLGNDSTVTATTAVAIPAFQSGVQTGVGGYQFTCLLMTDRRVKCFGENGNGQLGDGTTVNRLQPVDVGLADVVQIAAGSFNMCALTAQGAVYCWGYNGEGAVGDLSYTDRNSPTLVHGLATGVSAIALQEHGCAVMNDQSVKCWGRNSEGVFGNGLSDRSSIPLRIHAAP